MIPLFDSLLLEVLTSVVLAVAVLVVLSALVFVGWGRLVSTARDLPSRLAAITPYAVVLGAVLLVNKGTQTIVTDVSWLFNYNLTPAIYDIEGEFVANLQGLFSTEALLYFSFIYVIGYSFLLVFPIVAYLCLPEMRRLKELFVAYGLNYGIGVACYALFVAYGPRNVMPDTVGAPLYSFYPETMLLTTEVNTNTNVFPSLHTSLAVTVLLFAFLTRDEYPLWAAVATILSVSVVISTMALGIHWLIDVIAGLVLAVVAVAGSGPIVNRLDDWTARQREALTARLSRDKSRHSN